VPSALPGLYACAVRHDCERSSFEIGARERRARAGVLRTAHGAVATPAFIPLATKATVKSLSVEEVAGLGYGLILGNTYHLMLSPGERRIAELGGLHAFMGWEGAIITDSGGFQVFSLAHGTVAEEIKGRRGRLESRGAVLEISEAGVRFRSYRDGSEHTLSPERSMEVQARLGSDLALTLDECTPYHADRDYTARSTERTHRWLDRCLTWHERNGPRRQAVFGIVQGGVYADLRSESAQRVAAAAVDGISIGGTLGRDKAEMMGVLDMALPHLPEEAPKHLLGIGEPDDLLDGIARGIDVFDCSVPTRLARHGMALAPLPDRRFRFDLRRSAHAGEDRPLVEGCPCATCARHSRAYLHYLVRARELTGVRLLTLHNLAYMQALVAAARRSIEAGGFAVYRAALLAGAAPGRTSRTPPHPPPRSSEFAGPGLAGGGALAGVVADDLLEPVDLVADVVLDHLPGVGVPA
jgi:queuine tRNA-ribosyltransferase